MKRLAVLVLCLSMIPCCGMTAFAEATTVETDGAMISVSVPSVHTLKITANVAVAVNGEKGTTFSIDRLSEPTITVYPNTGEVIVKAILNGEDITSKLVDGTYTLPPVYEDLNLAVETKADAEPPTSGTEPTNAETTASSVTNSETSSTTTSEGSSTISSNSSTSNPSSSNAENAESNITTSTTASANGGTNNNGTTKTYPNNASLNTGDAMTVGIGVPAFFLGVAFLMMLLKKRNKDEE